MQIIIGSNYGDEGKGRVTSYFSNSNTLNVLTNGGAQRGHTAKYNGVKHVFHHLGSGTLKGATSYFFKDFLLDPVTYLNEKEELNKLGICPKVFRDKTCRWVTPYDVILNQELEKHRENKHGSCGMGIWETVKRYREMSCLNIDEFNNMRLYDKYEYLDKIRYRTWDILNNSDSLTKEMDSILKTQDLSKKFIEDVENFCKEIPCGYELWQIIPDYQKTIFENAQGLLLNSNPNDVHTTPSETGCKNIVDFIEENFKNKLVEIIYVTRPYLTRHGAGPFEEIDRQELNANFDETNIYNEWQGYIRYGKLNTASLLQRIENDFSHTYGKNNNYIKSLAITHLDEMELSIQQKNFYNIYEFRKQKEDFNKTHINRFRKEYFFLSNFFPCHITYNGLTYLNVEAAFQAQKTLNLQERVLFTNLTPKEARAKGRELTLREDWEEVKLKIMENIIRKKFSNDELKEQLLATKNAFIEEGNDFGDRYWGTVLGKGENNLGKILMKIRKELKT